MFRYIMKVNSENMEDMIFLKSFFKNLGGVLGRKEKSGASVPEVSLQRFHSRSSDLKVQVVLVQKFWKFWSGSSGGCGSKFRRLWSESSGGSGPEVPEVLIWRLGSSGVSSLEVLEVLVTRLQRFKSGSSGGSNPEVLEVQVWKFQWFQSECSRGSSLDVLEVPARKFSRFHYGSSGGSVTKALKVPIWKFRITFTDSCSEFFSLHNQLSSTLPYLQFFFYMGTYEIESIELVKFWIYIA
jgi:hypothetical protein